MYSRVDVLPGVGKSELLLNLVVRRSCSAALSTLLNLPRRSRSIRVGEPRR
eukprot:SAG11_NODE_12971_length_676_cov_1.429809_1_plen_50_part_01